MCLFIGEQYLLFIFNYCFLNQDVILFIFAIFILHFLFSFVFFNFVLSWSPKPIIYKCNTVVTSDNSSCSIVLPHSKYPLKQLKVRNISTQNFITENKKQWKTKQKTMKLYFVCGQYLRHTLQPFLGTWSR